MRINALKIIILIAITFEISCTHCERTIGVRMYIPTKKCNIYLHA